MQKTVFSRFALAALLTIVSTGRAQADDIALDATNFPDAVFRAWLSENWDTNNDGTLNDAEQNHTILTLQNKGVANLKGIELFQRVTQLNCAGNQLTELDLTQNRALTIIRCQNNHLQRLIVPDSPTLTKIFCQDNCLQDEDMDAFIESLPTLPSGTTGDLTLFDNSPNAVESNVYTVSNITTAAAKGWTSKDNYGKSLALTVDAKNFPDAQFLSYITANIDTNGDLILDEEEVAIKTLDVSNLGIADLTGIRYFTSLEELYCQHNQLTTLKVTYNKQLSVIHCYNNQLSADNLRSFIISLRTAAKPMGQVVCYSTADTEGNAMPTDNDIILAYNSKWRLYTIDAEGQTELIEPDGLPIVADIFPDVNVRSMLINYHDPNRDQVLSKAERDAITDLYLDGRNITTVAGIEYLTNLEKLSVNRNLLTELDASTLHKLKTLLCEDNQIQRLVVSKYSDLTDITCGMNRLDEYALTEFVASLPMAVPEGQLRIFNTQGGEQNDRMPSGLISECNDLHWHVLSYDGTATTELAPLTDVELNRLNFPDDVFREIVRQNFDRDNDGFLSGQERDQARSLTHFVSDDDRISDITGIALLPYLSELGLGGQDIAEADLSKNTELIYVRIYSSGVTKLDVSGCSKLEMLLCHNNKLATLNVSSNPNLKDLACSDNELTSLDLSQNTQLQSLWCQGNSLSTLDLSACPLLTEVRVELNNISGQGMTSLVNSLPATTEGQITVREFYKEQNSCTAEQALIARQKGWTVRWKDPIYIYAQYAGEPPVEISDAYFPDPNFRQYVADNIDTDHDGVLDLRECLLVTSVDVRNMGISDLTGLGFFTNLNELHCEQNQLTWLDLTYDFSLYTIYCEGNPFTAEAVDFLLGGLNRVSGNNPEHPEGSIVIGGEGCAPVSEDWVNVLNARNWRIYTFDGTSYTEQKPTNIKINEKTFPDPIFRQYVADNLDPDKDGILTKEELLKVKAINLFSINEWINPLDITGVEYFTQLTWLDCSYDDMTEIDLSKNTELEVLCLHGNHISSIDLSKNTKLTWLGLFNNGLTNLDVSRCPELTYLSCKDNKLKELSVLKNVKLETLEVSNCGLTQIDVSKCTELQKLIANDNSITDIDVSMCPQLTDLELNFSQLTDIDVSNCPQLKILKLNNNQLTDIDVSKNTKLEKLLLLKNNLKTIDVSNNPMLSDFTCGDNQLTALDISHNPELKWLAVINNQIRGAAMTKLVNDLPTVSDGTLWAYEYDVDDGNRIYKPQVAILKEKGWKVWAADKNGFWLEDYEGLDLPIGDVNDDGSVDNADVICIVNYLLGKPVPDFKENAADVDCDGKISIADVTRVVDIILGSDE